MLHPSNTPVSYDGRSSSAQDFDLVMEGFVIHLLYINCIIHEKADCKVAETQLHCHRRIGHTAVDTTTQLLNAVCIYKTSQ